MMTILMTPTTRRHCAQAHRTQNSGLAPRRIINTRGFAEIRDSRNAECASVVRVLSPHIRSGLPTGQTVPYPKSKISLVCAGPRVAARTGTGSLRCAQTGTECLQHPTGGGFRTHAMDLGTAINEIKGPDRPRPINFSRARVHASACCQMPTDKGQT